LKHAFFIGISMALTACGGLKPADTTVPKESRASLVTQGMTQNQVGEILGEFQREDFDPSNGYSSCRSYRYDAPPNARYVHVGFDGELVSGVADGKVGLCIYGGDVG